MSLEYATVPVFFEGALDQKKNYKAVLPGAFLTLQNCVRRKEALLEKRYGVTALPKALATTNPTSPYNPAITSGVRLGQSEDNLVMLDGKNAWGYAPNAGAWSPAEGVAAAVGWNNHQLVRSQADIFTADMAYCNGYIAVTFTNGTYNQGAAIYDAATGAVVISPQALPGATTSGGATKVCAVGDYFVFLYWSTASTLSLLSIKAQAGSTPSVQATNTATGLSYHFGQFDIENFDGTTAVLAVENSAATGITLAKIDPTTCAVTASATITASGATVSSVASFYGRIFVAYKSGTSLFAVVYNGALTTASAILTVDSTTMGTYLNASFVPRQNAAPLNDTPSGQRVSLIYDGFSASTAQAQIYSHVISWNGTGGASADGGNEGRLYAGMTLASRPFYGADQAIYFYALYDSTLQPTYFLFRFDSVNLAPACVAKFAQSVASHLPSGLSTSTPPSISRVMSDGTNFHTALRVVSSSVANTTQQVGFVPVPDPAVDGVDHYSVNIAGDYICKSLGRGMQVVSGGLVNHYDGVNIAEVGFHIYPEAVLATGATGGSLTASSTYYYRVIYEWVDNFGQVHRSCPSPIQNCSLTSGQNQFTVTIAALPVGSKDWLYQTNLAHYGTYKAVLYLAAKGDATLFYRHDSVSLFPYPGTATAKVSLTVFDEPIQSNELLYTTGGIVENIAPPAARCAHVHKNRMWLGGLENSELWFSKEWVRGEGVAFSDQQRIPIDTRSGNVTALATLDDKLIIFKKDRLYFLVGDGPDDAGNNWDYPEPIAIMSDVGTVQPNTVVEIPGGVIFKSLKGWYMLNRGMQLSYIGAGVEDYNSLNARSATVISDQNEVRFVHSNGDCLVYNYYFNQWSTFTNYLGTASILANGGTFYRLSADGTVNKEVVGQYNDNGTTYSMNIETAWFQFRKIQGFQRIYGFELIGDFFTHHTAQVSIAYDFNSAYNQTISYNTQTNGTTGPILQLRIQPQIQKCSAMKIKIQDIDNITVGGGASFKPTALTFDIAGKKGSFRLSGAQQTG